MTTPEAASATASIVMSAEAARGFAASLVASRGVPARDAETTARCLVRADLRGVDTHGIVRLPGYLDRISRGLVTAVPDLAPRQISACVQHLDGQDALGFVVATRAMAAAIEMARENGIGLVGVSRSTHYGMAANYVLQAAEAGFGSFVFTNASPAMPPWGGRAALLGTSPFAAGLPNPGGGLPFILDMAPSVAARGKIRKAAREGRSIPEGFALDAEGRNTTDPEAALKGVVLPMGGPKGSGLSMLMDLLCGVLTGAAFAGNVGDQYKHYERPQNVGHFIMAFRPDLFIDAESYIQRMNTLVETIKQNPTAEGFDEIMIPGEPESRNEAKRLREGISYRRDDLAPLCELAKEAGLPVPPQLA